jgi:uncharacterized protein (TIGR02646 family)
MIKGDRTVIPRPVSLDPTGVKYNAELSNNQNIVNDNAGNPWKDFKVTLAFKVYGEQLDVKEALSRLFNNKCAYCEISLDGQDLHTEHFRPKREVDPLDWPTSEGYWWLGAKWSNLLPACGHCNRSPGTYHPSGVTYLSGKSRRFPLLDPATRATVPGSEANEKYSLLEPTLDEPSEFISFKELKGEWLAQVISPPLSTEWKRADDTIAIIGLNRPGLVTLRNEHLKKVRDAVRQYLNLAATYNMACNMNVPQQMQLACKQNLDKQWDDINTGYLAEGRMQFLHATVRCIEEEFSAVGLSLNAILNGNDLYIPGHKIK